MLVGRQPGVSLLLFWSPGGQSAQDQGSLDKSKGRNIKVAQEDGAMLIKEDILRFPVPVDDLRLWA